MSGRTPKWLCVVLLVLVLSVSSAHAQVDDGDQQRLTAEQSDSQELESTDLSDRQEEIKKGTDIREAILENLDLKATEVEAKEVEGTEQVHTDEDKSQPSVDEALTEQGGSATEGEPTYWYHRFSPLIEKMRRVPVLGNKGWIHFGRAEIEYGYFNSSDFLNGESGFNFRSLRSLYECRNYN